MKFVLTTVVLFYTTSALFSQEDPAQFAPRHHFEASAAYARGYWKDIIFSPLNYRTQGAGYQLGYQRENRKRSALFQATLDGGFGQIIPARTDLSYFTSEYIVGNLTLGLLKLVPLKSDKLRLFLGPQYRLNVSYFDYRDQTTFSFVGSHTLDAEALLRYAFSPRHSVSSNVSVGLIGLVVRPPYGGYDTRLLYNYENRPLRLIVDGGRFASLFNYQLIGWNINYHFALTGRAHLTVHYAFNYQRVRDRFHPFVQALNQVGGGINFTL